MTNILLEVACSSPDDALAAQEGGAQRIELCSALAVGGVTPSAATLALTKEHTSLPVMVLLRPRDGGFSYSALEFAVMEADIDRALEQGAEGIVTGVLTPDGRIDIPRCRALRERIGIRQAVFHRAFDVTPDPFRALEELIDLRFTRVLTSGQKDRAADGAPLIRQLIEHAVGRIEILPGGGITPANVRTIVETTGCTQVHTSASATRGSTSTRSLASLGGEYRATDVAVVRSLVEQVRKF